MMRNYFLLILLLLLFSCERDPIFGLERGWLRPSENKKLDEDNGDNDPGDHDTSNVEYFITLSTLFYANHYEISSCSTSSRCVS